jgi:hypothetical protein
MKNNQITLIVLILLTIPILAQATIITGQGSSYVFNITNCNAQPTTPLNCSPSTIRYECTIENPAFIDIVEFRIDGTDYLATQNSSTPNQFYLIYNKPQDYTSSNTPLSFDRQSITDTNSKKVNSYEVVTINKNCELCSYTLTKTYLTNCSTIDQRIAQYTSSNETCIPSYNETETCNYCSENIQTTYTACNTNNTQTISYEDINYNTCCAITGLYTDCSIYSLYNTTQSCSIYTQDFNCTVDTAPVLHDKMNVVCNLPSSEPQNCVVNIYQQNNGIRNLLQTSPEYKVTTNAFFWARENEARTSFTNTNTLLNAYYTQKEIRANTDYDLEVVCSTNLTSITYNTRIRPQYATPDQVSHRLTWAKDNFAFVFITFIAIIIIIIVLLQLWYRIRG